jgi:hypothetical protein
MLIIYLFLKKGYYVTGFLSYLVYTFRPSLLLIAPFTIIYQLYKKNKTSAGKITLGFILGIIVFILTDATGLTAPFNSPAQNLLVSINSYGYDIDFYLPNVPKEAFAHPVKTYLSYVVTHPINYLEQRVLVLWSLWGPYVPTNLGIFANILHGLRFPFFIGAIVTFLYRKRFGNKKDLILMLFIPVLSLTIIHMLFFANQRHTFAAEPFVVLLSIIGIDYLLGLKNINLFFSKYKKTPSAG